MERAHDVVGSPLGPITLVAHGDALCGLFFEQRRHAPAPDRLGPRRTGALPAVAEQLDAWFAGERVDFDLPLLLRGTPFQRAVWAALRGIPFGRTETYGALARRLGRPNAARAVGSANAHNPVSLIVPCHRLVGADGDLTGYGGGLDRKRALLDFERRRSTQPGPGFPCMFG